MKKFLLLTLFILMPALVFAQFAVVSTQPANNTKNVPLQTTVSITFNEAIDTLAMNEYQNQSNFASFDSVISKGYSADQKTMFANVVLNPNRSYFVAFLNMKAKSGAVITTPYVFYFTTGAEFPPYSISGTVFSGSTGVSVEGSVVGIANVNIFNDEGKNGPPPFVGWTNVNANGTYTVPYLANGTYWPIAVKDVNHDGQIDPNNGVDVIAFTDSIIVNNASITNHNLTFVSFKPKSFQDAVTIADSLSKDLPVDRSLRRISAWDVDTAGTANSWEFMFMTNNNTQGRGIRISSSGSDMFTADQNYTDWLKQIKQITNYQTAASSATVVANVENAGGKAFRLLPHPDSIEFRIQLSMSDQKYSWFNGGSFDTSKIYWAVSYSQEYQVTDNQSMTMKAKYFLCDFATGAVILTQTMGVQAQINVPELFSLSQNYPNPFNPTTNIKFIIPVSGMTSLKIYDLLGKEVAILVDEKKDAGEYSVPFTGTMLPSGIYFYQLRSGNFVETKKMILLK